MEYFHESRTSGSYRTTADVRPVPTGKLQMYVRFLPDNCRVSGIYFFVVPVRFMESSRGLLVLQQ